MGLINSAYGLLCRNGVSAFGNGIKVTVSNAVLLYKFIGDLFKGQAMIDLSQSELT